MSTNSHSSNLFGIAWNSVLALMIVVLVLIVVILFIVLTAQPAQGQTWRMPHHFTARAVDGHFSGGVTLNASGIIRAPARWRN